MKKFNLQALIHLILIWCLLIPNTSFSFGGLVYSAQNGSGDVGSSSRGISDKDNLIITLGASLVGLIVGTFSKPNRENRRNRKIDIFTNRYLNSPRSMHKDLKRLRGKQFKWLMFNLLGISVDDHARFKCVVHLDQTTFEQYLKRAKSKKSGDIEELAWLLFEYRASTRNPRHKCQLLDWYLKDTKGVRFSIDHQFYNNKKNTLNQYVGVSSRNEGKRFRCLLLKKKPKLIESLDLIDKKKTRYQGLEQLDRLLQVSFQHTKQARPCK